MVLRFALPALGILVLAVGAIWVLPGLSEHAGRQAASVSAAEVVSLTNGEREGLGIARLSRNGLLDAAAQMKAEDMASKGYYAHVSPDGTTPMYFVEKAGYSYLIIGENLVVNRTEASQVVSAFMGSPGHRANILRKDFTEIGVGVAKGTYKGKDAVFTVQLFAAPKAVAVAPKPVPKAAAPAPVPTAVPAAKPQAPIAKPVAVPAIVRDVQKLVEPLAPLIATTTATSTATSSLSVATSTEYVPTLFHVESVSPIELAGVSRLETRTTPIPIGSNWSSRFQEFVTRIVLSARGFF